MLTRNMDARQINILIVEDESIIALDIKRMVEKLGYNVIAIVNNFKDAIKVIEKTKPELILMDIQIHGSKNGIESAESIFRKYAIPFIYVTALTDDKTLQNAKRTEPFGYIIKPFDEDILRTTIEMALYKFSVESELKKKTIELEREKLINDKLLRNILPEEIITELKNRGVVSPRLFKNISILFSDFELEGDTVENIPQDILLNELNDIFANADAIIKKYGLEKLKSSREMYMICGGIPQETDDHARKVVMAAMDIQSYLSDRNMRSDYKWYMKAGINSGQAIAGTVGTIKCTYDVWGEAVNIASRMESSSELGKINVSGSTYSLIKDYFECQYRGKIVAKGKGKLDMYFVTGVKKHFLN